MTRALREIRKALPGESLVYLADQAAAPYGEKSLDDVRARSEAVASFLIDQGAKTVVVACNSASAAALHHLRATFPDIPFVGMEPAVKPAAGASERGVIGVIATQATFQGELFASVVDRHASGVEVITQPCPGLSDLVEEGAAAPVVTSRLRELLDPLVAKGIDTLVLGCTHYTFLADGIASVVGETVTVVDPAPAVARQLERVLAANGMAGGVSGTVAYWTTGDTAAFSARASMLLGEPISAGLTDLKIGPDWPYGRVLASVAVLGSVVSVVHGDLTQQQVDVVVNAANETLAHGGGVAAALVRAGGAVVQEDSHRWVHEHGPLLAETAAITTAGSMPAHHVVHVVGPRYREGQDNEAMLRAAVTAALDASSGIDARSVAFPAISAGIFGYPRAAATAVIGSEVMAWLDRKPATIDEVRLVALDLGTCEDFIVSLGGPAP